VGTVNKNIGGLNQFSDAASLSLSHYFLEKKKTKKIPFTLLTRPLRNKSKLQESELIQNQKSRRDEKEKILSTKSVSSGRFREC